MSIDGLRRTIEELTDLPGLEVADLDRAREAVRSLLAALERGEARAAEPTARGWRVNRWVKKGILLAFRSGANAGAGESPPFHFRDRDTLPTWSPGSSPRDVRVVPGGTTVRAGAYVGEGVVIMPPAYVNVGAWIGEHSMIDSHVLVGSCAQVGRRVHLSAAAQIGGVLEPVGAMPVIIEDDVFVGGGCGVYEGTRVERGAVLAAGVILTRSVPVFDLVREVRYRAGADRPLVVPERAVVVPGGRPAPGAFARAESLSLHAPVIVKYRDGTTEASVALEEALR